ncbi:IclR family transcriptional regulator domain-containing protein [Segnochrobactraceae bacterium EtOH-i3]
MTEMQADERDGSVIAGFAKGLAVIEVFDRGRERLTIADVARLTGLERATARRCLMTLVKTGHAEFDGKFYQLTPRVLRLGYSYLASAPLPRVVQPVLERLAEAIGESCSVSVLDGTEIVYVARASEKRVMSISLGAGSRLPASSASMGRVLLAALPEDEARRRVEAGARTALTPNTKVSVEAILEAIREARTQGYAIGDQELEIGLRSIAVPLFSSDGRVVAAMNVGGHASRLPLDRLTGPVLDGLREAQADLRRVLG